MCDKCYHKGRQLVQEICFEYHYCILKYYTCCRLAMPFILATSLGKATPIFAATRCSSISTWRALPGCKSKENHRRVLIVRPFIAVIHTLTSTQSQYIDIQLQKYVIKLDSYLKHTTSLTCSLHDIDWKPYYRWATLDLLALYSNIPHVKGLFATSKFLSEDLAMLCYSNTIHFRRNRIYSDAQHF